MQGDDLVFWAPDKTFHWCMISVYSHSAKKITENVPPFLPLFFLKWWRTQSITAKDILITKVRVPKWILFGRYDKSWWLKDSTQKVSRHCESAVNYSCSVCLCHTYSTIVLRIAVDQGLLQSLAIRINGLGVSELDFLALVLRTTTRTILVTVEVISLYK